MIMTAPSPELFGIIHIFSAIISVAIAIIAARSAAGFVVADPQTRSSQFENANPVKCRNAEEREQMLVRILFVTGFVLLVLEVLKQMYLMMISGGGSYDWWYFPFQLCSVPMYLCLLLPFVKGPVRSSFLTFMSGYTFVSALAALIYPEDILHAAPPLMFHGFLWHAVLLFISLLIFMTGAYDVSARGLLRSAVLFLVLCAIAVVINVLAEPVMQTGNAAHSYAAMFYLNPYHISPQPIVNSVQKTAGIPAGLIIYVFAIAAVSSLVTLLLSYLCSHIVPASNPQGDI